MADGWFTLGLKHGHFNVKHCSFIWFSNNSVKEKCQNEYFRKPLSKISIGPSYLPLNSYINARILKKVTMR